MKIRDLLPKLKRQWRILVGSEPAYYAEVAVPTMALGHRNASWRVAEQFLSADSVAYSFGIGEDISFELALIERKGMRMHGFDPTPRSAAWLAKQELPTKFCFHDIGLHASDGELTFYPPLKAQDVSFSTNKAGHDGHGVTLKVRRLSSIMEELGHAKIDLLKMDIEGSEYGVIEDIIKSGIIIDQLLVEFHHRMLGFKSQQTVEAVQQMMQSGYRLINVSVSGREYVFVHTRLLAPV